MESPKCSHCQKKYTKLNPPYQLINCSHSLCKKCLITQNQCPLCDKDIGMDEYQLSEYQILSCEEIKLKMSKKQQIKLVEKENSLDGEDDEQIYNEECLLHSKPADLICLEDNEIICCNCALFGEHKGHEVINSEGILNKMTNYIEECLSVYEELKLIKKEFNGKVHTQNYMHILDSEKEKNKNFIDQKYGKLISLIEIEHRKTLMKLESIYKTKQENLKKALNFEDITQKSASWFSHIEQLGGMMENTDNLQKLAKCVPYIDNSGKGEKILEEGEKMIEELRKMKQKAELLYNQEQKTGILTNFNEDLFNKAEKFCKFGMEKAQTTVKKTGGQIVGIQNQLSLKKIPSQMNKGMIESELISSEVQCNNYPSCFKIQGQSQMKESTFTEQNLLLQSVEQIPFQDNKSNISINRNIFGQKMTKTNNYMYNENFQDRNQSYHKNNEHQENQRNVYINENYEDNGDRIATEVHIDNIPLLSISDIKPLTNVSSYPSSDQSRFLSRDKELQDIINVNLGTTGNLNALQIGLENQKKKKNGKLEQVAEKYKGIVDDLKNDRAETIDLTGADLGDANISTLCSFIKKSKKLKILKLIKNKLTDDCIPQLLVSLADSKVVSLNLSQNLLTDKICEYLPDYNNSNIKTLTLTLNKINRRQAKSKLDHLSKRGLNVVL